MFEDELKKNGWTELAKSEAYRKGDWQIYLDTSSWLMIETKHNPYAYGVMWPNDRDALRTVSLIEHLCSMEDERYRLRAALELIRDAEPESGAARTAEAALAQCYHNWLCDFRVPEGERDGYYCPICGMTKKKEEEKSENTF
jgi:hypothetical protein